jgi:hypothetical protein
MTRNPHVERRFQTPERLRPPARVYRRFFAGCPGEPMYRPGLLAQETPKAGRLRRIPARRRVRRAENSTNIAEGRRSFADDRPASAGRPPHPALARTGPGGPGEQALRRRTPGAEPTSALQMADSKPRHPWMTRHTFAGSPPTSSPMVHPLSAAFGAPGSEATGRRRRRRGLARSQGTSCVLVWRPLGLAFRGKRSRSAHAPAP